MSEMRFGEEKNIGPDSADNVINDDVVARGNVAEEDTYRSRLDTWPTKLIRVTEGLLAPRRPTSGSRVPFGGTQVNLTT